MTRKKMPEKLKDSEETYAKQRQSAEVSDKVCQKVKQGAERAASSEAKLRR